MPALPALAEVHAGEGRLCGIDGGASLWCWGWRNHMLDPDPPEGSWDRLSVGAHHACARRSGGGVACWGYEESERRMGPLALVPGVGGIEGDTRPLGIEASDVVEVAAGGRHTCLATGDGVVVCLGDDRYGQAQAPPVALHGLAAGLDFTCGLDATSRPVCWGLGVHGQTQAPDRVLTGLSAGRAMACGLDAEGALACWGEPEGERFGQVPDGPGWEEVAIGATWLGEERLCARRRGETSCVAWNQPATQPPMGLSALALGGRHACGLDALRQPTCWHADLVGHAPIARPTFRWRDHGR